jgi:hypothetical protein
MDDATVLLTDDFYQNYWKGDELKEAHMKSAIKLLSAIDYRQVDAYWRADASLSRRRPPTPTPSLCVGRLTTVSGHPCR